MSRVSLTPWKAGKLVPETVAQDAQVPVAIARALEHLLGAVAGRDQAHPSFGDGSSATEQLWSEMLAGGKGGEGQEETRITRRDRREEEVGQAKEELCREEDAGEGVVQRGESPAGGAATPCRTPSKPISLSSC